MRINRREMKHDARLAMRSHRPGVFAVALLLIILLWVLEVLSVKLLYPGENLLEIAEHLMEMSEAQTILPDTEMSFQEFAERYAEMEALTEPSSGLGRLIDVAISIMKLMLGVGFTLFCMNVARGAAAGAGTLFDAFGYFFKVLWLSIIISILTTLWTMLFIFPGWIAHYRYSFAYYILLDDPDKSALECIQESKELTRGHKWELFVLDISFLGWFLLSLIPFVAIYTKPYIEITRINYYRSISGRMNAPEYLLEAESSDDE